MKKRNLKKGDWVLEKGCKPVGYVKRVAKDGSWADVKWTTGDEEVTRRMNCDELLIVTTIPVNIDS